MLIEERNYLQVEKYSVYRLRLTPLTEGSPADRAFQDDLTSRLRSMRLFHITDSIADLARPRSDGGSQGIGARKADIDQLIRDISSAAASGTTCSNVRNATCSTRGHRHVAQTLLGAMHR